MDYILMGEFALRRINISKAGQDFWRRWHNDLAACGVGTYRSCWHCRRVSDHESGRHLLCSCPVPCAAHRVWYGLLNLASIFPWCLRSGQTEVAPSWFEKITKALRKGTAGCVS